MDINQQRALATTLAEQGNALKTLDALKNPNLCFKDILPIALAEVGPERLVGAIESGDPMWAYNALRFLPQLASYRSALLQKAAETQDAAVHTLRFVGDLGSHELALRASAGALADPVAVIDKFEFDNSEIYVAYFAMKWTHNGVTYQVTRETGDPGGPWPGGGGIWKGDYDKVSCEYFPSVSNHPLSGGDIIWVVAMAADGASAETPVRMTYQPGATRRAKFTSTGSVQSVGIDYGGNWPA